MFKVEKLDHGVLSMPNRTKNINSDLDKYNAEKAKSDKRNIEDRKFLNTQHQLSAKEIFNTLEKKHFQFYAKKAGISILDARMELKAMIVNPKKATNLFNAIIELELKKWLPQF